MPLSTLHTPILIYLYRSFSYAHSYFICLYYALSFYSLCNPPLASFACKVVHTMTGACFICFILFTFLFILVYSTSTTVSFSYYSLFTVASYSHHCFICLYSLISYLSTFLPSVHFAYNYSLISYLPSLVIIFSFRQHSLSSLVFCIHHHFSCQYS